MANKKSVKDDLVDVPVADVVVDEVAVESDVVVSDVVEVAPVDVVSVEEPAKEPAKEEIIVPETEQLTPAVEYPGSLRIGYEGPSVAELQRLLVRFGYDNVYTDGTGTFGVWTSGALRAFNREVANKEQSILDQETWTLLQS